MRAAITAALLIWALSAVFGEALAQVGLYACLLLALLLIRAAPRDVRLYASASLAYAAWQALSPALALATGTATAWPASLRYGQFPDTLGGAAVAIVAQTFVPWTVLALTLAAGWATSVWLGAWQHFSRWPFGQPPWMRTPVERVYEEFGSEGSTRYGAGGWLFHRLRFGHGAIALLGPALAVATSKHRMRWVAAALALHLVAATYFSFARAALGVALLLTLAALLLRLKGRARGLALGAVVLAALLPLASDSWHERVRAGVHNLLGGERETAMTTGWKLITAHPLTGVGFGNHQSVALASGAADDERLATDSHDLFLTVWAETGLIGVALWLAMHALWLKAAITRARAGSLAAVAGLFAWAAFMALGLVHYLPYHTGVHLTFSLVFGLALAREA